MFVQEGVPQYDTHAGMQKVGGWKKIASITIKKKFFSKQISNIAEVIFKGKTNKKNWILNNPVQHRILIIINEQTNLSSVELNLQFTEEF